VVLVLFLTTVFRLISRLIFEPAAGFLLSTGLFLGRTAGFFLKTNRGLVFIRFFKAGEDFFLSGLAMPFCLIFSSLSVALCCKARSFRTVSNGFSVFLLMIYPVRPAWQSLYFSLKNLALQRGHSRGAQLLPRYFLHAGQRQLMKDNTPMPNITATKMI
jgi:hypothetical protein